MIPERVLEAVAARSGGGSRRVNLSRCPSCGWPALRGADADRCGAGVRVDPVPLTPPGEAPPPVRGLPAGRRSRWFGEWRRSRFTLNQICGFSTIGTHGEGPLILRGGCGELMSSPSTDAGPVGRRPLLLTPIFR